MSETRGCRTSDAPVVHASFFSVQDDRLRWPVAASVIGVAASVLWLGVYLVFANL